MAAAAQPPVEREFAISLSLWGWMLTLLRATGITFALMYKAIKAALSGQKNGLTFYDYIAFEGMREYQSGLSAVRIQNLLAPTARTVAKVAKKHGISHTKVHLQDGTVVVRLGKGRIDKVVVQLHGGAYMAPALPQHVEVACGFAKSLPDNTSVYILQYSLASETANHYPRQLQQAAALMDHLLHSESVPASAITLIGDSAGAHLALSLLLHLTHPNPKVTPVRMEGRLHGAALISPWVIDMNPDSESMKVNGKKDLLDAAALAYWTRNFLGDSEPDYWNSHLTVPAGWWPELPVEEVLITSGDNELLRDGAVELSNAIRAGHSRTTTGNYTGELHAHMLMNRFLHINKPCESERVFKEWLQDRLKAG